MKKKKTDSQRRSEAFAKWQAEREAAKPARQDEWTESAENEPDADEADREWAQMLTEETEDEQC